MELGAILGGFLGLGCGSLTHYCFVGNSVFNPSAAIAVSLSGGSLGAGLGCILGGVLPVRILIYRLE
jgi:hypothetical protein